MSKTRTVLLVEDEPLITMLFEDVLLDTEFTLSEVSNCNKAAIALVLENRFDLVIVDYNLADGPCLPLIEKLREHSMRFLISSGYEEPPTPDLVGLPWISKPFRIENLLRLMRNVCGNEACATPATAENCP